MRSIRHGQVGNVQHAFKGNWVYELPFGHGRAFGSSVGGFIDELSAAGSSTASPASRAARSLDFGNVRLVGMSAQEDLQKAQIKLRVDAAVQRRSCIYILPQDIIDNTVKAFSVERDVGDRLRVSSARRPAATSRRRTARTASRSAPGYGDCGIRSLVVTGPRLVRFDLSAVKRVRIRGNVSAEMRIEMLNALNSPYFNPASTAGQPLGMSWNTFGPNGPTQASTPTSNAVAGASADSFRLTQLLGDNQSRIIQLVWRVRW